MQEIKLIDFLMKDVTVVKWLKELELSAVTLQKTIVFKAIPSNINQILIHRLSLKPL